MSKGVKWVAAVWMTSLLGCAADIDDSAETSSSALSAPPASNGGMKQRALPRKPARAVQSRGLIPDQIIVKFKEGTRVRLRSGALRFDPGALVGNEQAILARNGLAAAKVASDVAAANALLGQAALDRHFDRPEPDLEREKALGEANTQQELADLNLYYTAHVDSRAQSALIDQLNALDSVELAYAPAIPQDAWADVPPATPVFTANQAYVNAAPVGM